jgi:UDP-3-O-[3-hydroxymyristoyl] glucosamine N-acyltransferase
VYGDGDTRIEDAAPLHEARPGFITFAENDRHLRDLNSCQASAIVVKDNVPLNGHTLIRVADPLSSFLTIVRHLRGLNSPTLAPGIDPRAAVDATAVIGPGTRIGPFVSVGAGAIIGANCLIYAGVVVGAKCRIGDNCVLHPNVVLYDGVVLGRDVILHANAVLGADGFGYRFQQGQHVKVPQLGWVEVGDAVEIGSCSTVDRGTVGPTRIGSGSKIDNLVMIGHNCQIGAHNILAGQVGIAGSTTTGPYVVMAGQVGIADHLNIAGGVTLGPQSGVGQDIAEAGRYMGTPPLPEHDQRRLIVTMCRLVDMRRDVQKIKKHLNLE